MKRSLACILCLVLLVALFPSAALGEEKITVWMCSWWEDAVPKIIETFEADPANEGYSLTIETFPINGYLDKITAAVLGGTAPDVVDVDVTMIGSLVRHGLLEPFTEADLEGIDVSDFVSGAWTASAFGGQQYGLPNRSSSGAFMYNKAIFDAAGVAYPQDGWVLSDMLAKCEELKGAITEEGVYPFVCAVSPSDPSNFTTSFDTFVWGCGGDYMTPNQDALAMDTPEGIAAIEAFVDLFNKGYVPEGAINYTLTNDAVPLFCQGKVAMMPYTSSWTTIIKESGIDYDVCLAPGGASGAGGYSFLIPVTAKNIDGGKKFSKWFTQADVLGELMIRTPSRISTNKNYAPWNDADNEIFIRSSAYTRSLPGIPEWADFRLIMIEEMQKAIMGLQDAETTGKTMAERCNALLAEAE